MFSWQSRAWTDTHWPACSISWVNRECLGKVSKASASPAWDREREKLRKGWLQITSCLWSLKPMVLWRQTQLFSQDNDYRSWANNFFLLFLKESFSLWHWNPPTPHLKQGSFQRANIVCSATALLLETSLYLVCFLSSSVTMVTVLDLAGSN